MRISTLLFGIAIAICQMSKAQDCVDSTLIDMNTACPLNYDPVCGCNGVTYGNACAATYFGGVTSFTAGECQGGSNCMDMSGLGFGLCDMFLGYTWLGNSCGPMSGCSYVIGNIDYSPNFYQSPWECQQTCGQPATDCINYWQIEQGYLVDCAPAVEPVCGCNGVSYSNNCMAYYLGGATTYSLGDCTQENCMVIPIATNFGKCAMALGWARLETGCAMLSGCGYVGQNGYNYSELFFTNEENCLAGCNADILCIDTTLINLDSMCPTVIVPVCGCDNITYNNSCEALNWHGVTSYTPGVCGNSIPSISKDQTWTIYPNPVIDLVTVQFERDPADYIRIINSMGMLVYAMKPNAQQVTIDASDWAGGLYIIQAQHGDNSYATTVITKTD